MLAQWLSRGLGQIVAPDPQHESNDGTGDDDDNNTLFSASFWNMVAPDPNFCAPNEEKNEKEKEASPVSQRSGTPSDSRFKTPNKYYHHSSQKIMPFQSPDASSFHTPKSDDHFHHDPTSNTNSTPGTTLLSEVEWQVLVATRETAFSLNSPPMEWESRKDFFNICTSTRVNKKKLINRFKRDRTLIHSRSSNMSNFVPDGLTPLMAAASHGNLEICQLLLELLTTTDTQPPPSTTTATSESTSTITTTTTGTEITAHPEEQKKKKHNQRNANSHLKDALEATNLQGKTALHLAAENHQLEIVRLIRDTMKEHNLEDPVGEHAPLDLVGRTPLGYAALSSKKQKFKRQLEQELFAVGDNSVFGGRTPAKQRGNYSHIKQQQQKTQERSLMYGWSDIPGYRIDMEDAMCHHYPLTYKAADTTDATTMNNQWGLFGVFDGHADQGVVSSFLADHMIHVLQNTDEFEHFQGGTSLMAQALKSACISIDVDLKAWLKGQRKSVQKGGSTGVLAAVTDEAIIIANVGDSRCILVQKAPNVQPPVSNKPNTEEELQNQLEKLTVNDTDTDTNKEKNEEKEDKNVTQSSSPVIAKAMSIDHKPNLEEERIRIEKAGMNVIPEVFRAPNSHPDDEEAYTTIWKVEKSEMEKLATSRAFGDFDYKGNTDLPPEEQAVVSVPDFEVHVRDEDTDLFLVLACDGIWDVMSNQEVADFIYSRVNEKKESLDNMESILPEVGDDLLKNCLDLGSRDNMSVLIIAFSPDRNLQLSSSKNQNKYSRQLNPNDDVKRAMDFLDD